MWRRKEFATEYAQQLIQYNGQYLDLKETRDRLFQTVGFLESERHTPGKAYHLIQPLLKESIMVTTLSFAEGLEGEPKLRLYIYIDDNFIYKTKTFQGSSNPNINLEIDM